RVGSLLGEKREATGRDHIGGAKRIRCRFAADLREQIIDSSGWDIGLGWDRPNGFVLMGGNGNVFRVVIGLDKCLASVNGDAQILRRLISQSIRRKVRYVTDGAASVVELKHELGGVLEVRMLRQ